MQNNHNKANQLTDFSVEGQESISKVVELIESCLLVFNKQLTTISAELNKDLNLGLQRETYLNSKLCLLLQATAASNGFSFLPHHEKVDKEEDDETQGINSQQDRRVDIAFFASPSTPYSFFDLECKRLYSTNQRHYVLGNTGGIKRFKHEEHGQNCAQSAIVGYMQAETFDFWHTKINDWIDSEISKTNQEVTWAIDDKLKARNDIAPILSKCQSTHKRKTLSEIHLTHLWVNLQNNAL